MYPYDDDVYLPPRPDEHAHKRKTRSWHYDETERYAQQAKDAVNTETSESADWQYSEWCQRQGLLHATLAGGSK